MTNEPMCEETMALIENRLERIRRHKKALPMVKAKNSVGARHMKREIENWEHEINEAINGRITDEIGFEPGMLKRIKIIQGKYQ